MLVREEDVDKIVASTAFTNRRERNRVLKQYEKGYWDGNKKATRIALRLIRQGKVEQPRLRGKRAHNIAEGHWE